MTEPIVAQDPVVTPEPPKEFRYEYQPEENGVALGGKQVIIYDGTPEDLGRKMAAQNSELIKLNRKLNKQARLSSSFVDTIPDNAPRFDPSKYELKPEPLTAEERMQLAQDINDPEKFDAVSQRLVRAQIGDPEVLRTRMSRIEQRLDRSNVHEEALAFRRSRPDYYPTNDNLHTLAAWIEKNNLDPIKENFELAFDTLKEYLEPRPAAPAPTPVAVQPAPVVEAPPAPPARPVSSGLTRDVASNSGPITNPGDEIVYEKPTINRQTGKIDEYGPKIKYTGYEALERMPSEEYKRRLLKEPGFREKVDALDNAHRQKKAGQ